MHTLLLAFAGVLLGHMAGYSAADPGRAVEELGLGGHEYIGPLAVVAVPVGMVSLLAMAVRSVRRNGRGLPTVRDLVVAQVGLFVVQELVERIPGAASPLSAVGERAVWFGLIAQVLIAWCVARLVHWTARVVRQVAPGTRQVSRRAPAVAAISFIVDALARESVLRLPHRRGPPARGGSLFSAVVGPGDALS